MASFTSGFLRSGQSLSPLKSRIALKYNAEKPFGKRNTALFGTIEWVHSNADNHVDTDAGELRLSSWDIMNIRAGCRFKSFTVHLGMDNVFDRKYMVANSYEWDVIGGSGATPAIVNEPGRFFYASLEMIG